MRKFMVTCAALTFVVVAMVAPAIAVEKTIRGELVDLDCYTKMGKEKGAGAGHATCAQTCAKKGQQAALVATDGVYLVKGDLAKENNAKLVGHMSHTVELTGDVTESGSEKTIAAVTLKMISK